MPSTEASPTLFLGSHEVEEKVGALTTTDCKRKLPPKHMATQEAVLASSSVPLECMQHPPGIVIQIGPGCGSANGIVCTQAASFLGTANHNNTAAGAAMPSRQPFMDLRLGQAHISSGDFANPLSGVFGIAMLVAIGFALWYREKLHRTLSTHTHSNNPIQGGSQNDSTTQSEHGTGDSLEESMLRRHSSLRARTS
jgi:hypothetical protein